MKFMTYRRILGISTISFISIYTVISILFIAIHTPLIINIWTIFSIIFLCFIIFGFLVHNITRHSIHMKQKAYADHLSSLEDE